MPIAKESISIIGDSYFGASQSVFDRTSCKVNPAGQKRDCPIKQFYANPEIPDSKERIKEAREKWTFYNAWVNLRKDKLPSQSNLLPEEGESDESKQTKRDEFWQRVQAGEDFSFPITGYGESGPEIFGKELWVNPIHGLGKVELPSIDDTLIHVTDSIGINFTVIDGHLIIGTYAANSEGQIYKDWPGQENRLSIGPAAIAEWEAVLIGDALIMRQLKTQGRVNILNHKLYEPQQIEVQNYLIPKWNNLPYEKWISALLVK